MSEAAKTAPSKRRARRMSQLGLKLRAAMLAEKYAEVDKIMTQITNLEQNRKRRLVEVPHSF